MIKFRSLKKTVALCLSEKAVIWVIIVNSIYDEDIFSPLTSDVESFCNTYTMVPELWQKFSIEGLDGVDFSKWKSLKLMEGESFSSKISTVPNHFGGIYVYCIEPQIIPFTGCYVMYIGKATKTSSENLRARIKSYNSEVGVDFKRERLHRLFSKWGEYVYVHYLAIDSTPEVITATEDRLIAAFGRPPCNSDVRIKSVKQAVRAFN